MVQPHSEHWVQVWAPQYEMDTELFIDSKEELEKWKRVQQISSLFPCRRNILPTFSSSYLKNCIHDAQTDPFCPIFRLGKIVEAAGQNFQEMAVEVFGRIFSWGSALHLVA